MRSLIPMVGSIVTPPAQPAMTVDHARRHIRALTLSDDVLIASWIAAGTQLFEEQTGRAVITQTREVWLDAFPGYVGAPSYACGSKLELPNPPLQSVESVIYIASDGTETSFSDGGSPDTPLYTVGAPQGPHASRGWVEPLSGQTWPQIRAQSGGCRIRYVCGYGDTPEDVPELVTAFLCYLVAYYDRYRPMVADQSSGSVTELPYVRMTLDSFKYSAYPEQKARGYQTVDGLWL